MDFTASRKQNDNLTLLPPPPCPDSNCRSALNGFRRSTYRGSGDHYGNRPTAIRVQPMPSRYARFLAADGPEKLIGLTYQVFRWGERRLLVFVIGKCLQRQVVDLARR